MKFNKIFEVGILKTLIFNIHYFGLKGLKFPVVVSRKVKFENLKGRVECKYYKTASIHLGFSGVSIFDYNNERSIWDNEGGGKYFSKDKLHLDKELEYQITEKYIWEPIFALLQIRRSSVMKKYILEKIA